MQIVAEQSETFEVRATLNAAVLDRWSGPELESGFAPEPAHPPDTRISEEPASGWHGLSPWSRSSAKRVLDCACVVLAVPVVAPLMFIAAVMVRLTSTGPILFRQERMGRAGRPFTIFKFRTMVHSPCAKHHPVTTSNNQRFTPVGPFLRRWKLDELPQIVNVLRGELSLVGPRPKLPEHTISDLPCRPGITGLATVAFANEESVLADVPKDFLKQYYHSFVLPLKQQLDASYMARATLLSDLQIILRSVMRRGECAALDGITFTSVTGPKRNMATRSRHTDNASASLQETHRGVRVPEIWRSSASQYRSIARQDG